MAPVWRVCVVNGAPDTPRIILVAGPSGAGKTVLSLELVEALGASVCMRIGMDDYYSDLRYTPVHARAAINFDHPSAIDWALLTDHVDTLAAGRPIRRPVYDFVTHTRTQEWVEVHPLPYIVIDGIHALADALLVDAAAVSVYVDAQRDMCLERRLERDTVDRGRSEASVRNQFDETVWPMAEQHILPMREQADLVVAGDTAVEDSVRSVLGWLSR